MRIDNTGFNILRVILMTKRLKYCVNECPKHFLRPLNGKFYENYRI